MKLGAALSRNYSTIFADGSAFNSKTAAMPTTSNQRKHFQPPVLMKRLDWNELNVSELNEDCFWLRADDRKFENQYLFTQLMASFGHKKSGDIVTSNSITTVDAKPAELKVLDEKTAENLSLFIKSMHVDFQTLKEWIMKADDKLTDNFINDLQRILPRPDTLLFMKRFSDQTENLLIPEQFLCIMSDIPRVTDRLEHIKFMRQFDELVADIKPNIVAATAAMQDVMKSKKFSSFLELLLLIGNFMNSVYGSSQTVGFDITYLAKLKDTNNAENTETMMMFLAKMIEEQKEKNYEDVYGFIDDFIHMPKAAKVSKGKLARTMILLKEKLEFMEADFLFFDDPNDLLFNFLARAKEEYSLLEDMFNNMDDLFDQVVSFYAIDYATTSMKKFFAIMNAFRADYLNAVSLNKRARDQEEKRTRMLKRDGGLLLKGARRFGIDDSSHGLMDSLFAAIQSGEAFIKPKKREKKEQPSKKAPVLEKFEARSFLTSPDKSDVLGRGSFGTVRRCYHDALKWVVVKCFSLTGSEAKIDEALRDAAKEASIVTRLKHTNIVRVFGVTWWSNCFGIVMEEINGGCLEDLLLSKVELPWKIRLKILVELAAALEHLHCNFKRPYVHGDIKPQNILLTDELITKLVDFGSLNIAQVSGVSTATVHVSSTQHTPYYSAPEVLKSPGSERYPSADIYSFGMVEYELITRQRVFEGCSYGMIVYLIQDQGQKPDLEPVKKVEESLSDAGSNRNIFRFMEKTMTKCWHTEASERPTVKKVCEELQEIAISENIYAEENLAQAREIAQGMLKRDLCSTVKNKVSLHNFFHPFDACFPQEQIEFSDATSINQGADIETALSDSSDESFQN